MKSIYIFLFIFVTFTAQAQGILHTQGITKMDRGKDAMYDGDYLVADKLFKEALASIEKLPSQLVYFFGRNSYHLKRHKQAIDWLNKYIALKGTVGQYSDEAIKYLEQANLAYVESRSNEIEAVANQLNNEGRIDCPNDRVICPVCQGSGVVITAGSFELNYKICPYSGLEGILTCDEYNLYLKGQLDPKDKVRD